MKKIFLIILSVLSYQIAVSQTGYYGYSASESSSEVLVRNEKAVIQVFSPLQEVYDDGVFSDVFSEYKIYDMEGNELITVSASYDSPRNIEIEMGQYFVKFYNDTAFYELNVSMCNKLEFRFPL